jgi:hypothetical protein
MRRKLEELEGNSSSTRAGRTDLAHHPISWRTRQIAGPDAVSFSYVSNSKKLAVRVTGLLDDRTQRAALQVPAVPGKRDPKMLPVRVLQHVVTAADICTTKPSRSSRRKTSLGLRTGSRRLIPFQATSHALLLSLASCRKGSVNDLYAGFRGRHESRPGPWRELLPTCRLRLPGQAEPDKSPRTRLPQQARTAQYSSTRPWRITPLRPYRLAWQPTALDPSNFNS